MNVDSTWSRAIQNGQRTIQLQSHAEFIHRQPLADTQMLRLMLRSNCAACSRPFRSCDEDSRWSAMICSFCQNVSAWQERPAGQGKAEVGLQHRFIDVSTGRSTGECKREGGYVSPANSVMPVQSGDRDAGLWSVMHM